MTKMKITIEGPQGCGKTQLAEGLAEALCKSVTVKVEGKVYERDEREHPIEAHNVDVVEIVTRQTDGLG